VSHSRFRWAVLAAVYGFSIYVFVRLPFLVGLGPGPVAIPWQWRALTAFFFPTAALVILLIFKSIMSRDPFRENYPRFRRTFELLLDVATVLIIGVHLTLLGHNLLILRAGIGRWFMYVPSLLVGATLLVVGNILPRLRPTAAMGVRTPWTLGDEAVWARTHRWGGYLLFALGVAQVGCTLLAFQWVWLPFFLSAVVVAIVLPVLSYLLWRPRTNAVSPTIDRPAGND